MRRISAQGEGATGFVVYYAEIVLRSTSKKVFLDFVESNRNNYQDADLVSSNFTEQPLKQIRITNDGGADFIRVGFNGGSNGPTYIKIKFNETLVIPFTDTENELVLDMVLKAETSNTTVRVIGL
jgi:hypothetical protein